MRVKLLACIVLLLALFASPAQADVVDIGSGMNAESVSYYYGTGYPTCSGTYYDGYQYIAAAYNYYNGGFYPLGTVLDIYNPDTGLSTTVTVADCTPNAYWGGNFDISYVAARDLGMLYEGRSYNLVITPR